MRLKSVVVLASGAAVGMAIFAATVVVEYLITLGSQGILLDATLAPTRIVDFRYDAPVALIFSLTWLGAVLLGVRIARRSSRKAVRSWMGMAGFSCVLCSIIAIGLIEPAQTTTVLSAAFSLAGTGSAPLFVGATLWALSLGTPIEPNSDVVADERPARGMGHARGDDAASRRSVGEDSGEDGEGREGGQTHGP